MRVGMIRAPKATRTATAKNITSARPTSTTTPTTAATAEIYARLIMTISTGRLTAAGANVNRDARRAGNTTTTTSTATSIEAASDRSSEITSKVAAYRSCCHHLIVGRQLEVLIVGSEGSKYVRVGFARAGELTKLIK